MTYSVHRPVPYFAWSHSIQQKSVILKHPEDSVIVSFLPPNLQKVLSLHHAVSVYASPTHGFSLRALYSAVEKARGTVEHYCLLLIRAAGSQVVFGAFLSHLPGLSNPNTYFGTSECFVFKCRPMWEAQAWYSSPDAPQYYICASPDYMCIGGGGDGMAIRLDKSLQSGVSDKCSVFNNPPLSVRSSRLPHTQSDASHNSDAAGTDDPDASPAAESPVPSPRSEPSRPRPAAPVETNFEIGAVEIIGFAK